LTVFLNIENVTKLAHALAASGYECAELAEPVVSSLSKNIRVIVAADLSEVE
jgi:hypothetical protein